MAVKIKLEKDGFVKDGFVGYSYTSVFFNIWIPAFRLDFNGFIIFFIIYLIKALLPIFIVVNALVNYQNIRNLSVLFYLRIIFYIVNLFIGAWYNKYYTRKMLEDGWKLLENDEYSSAILKGYRYLDYTEFEMSDSDKMERYREILTKVQKSERNKFILFLIPVVIICLIIFL